MGNTCTISGLALYITDIPTNIRERQSSDVIVRGVGVEYVYVPMRMFASLRMVP